VFGILQLLIAHSGYKTHGMIPAGHVEGQFMTDFTGPVVKRNFNLTAPDWIEVQVQGTTTDPSDIINGHSVKPRLSVMH